MSGRRSFLAGAASAILGAALPAPAGERAPKFIAWNGGATPPLSLKDARGREHDLGAYRGKVVVVNFWATWCEPCREEMPSLEELQEKFKGRPFAILTVNMEESEEKVARFMESTLLQPGSLTVLYDRFGTAAKAWKARFLPVTHVVGADGRVRHSLLGAADWSSPEVLARIEPLLAAPVRK